MQRKVFRIEQMLTERTPRAAAGRRGDEQRPSRAAARATTQPAQGGDARSAPQDEFQRDVAAINHAIERSKHEIAALAAQPGAESRMAHARHALAAAIGNMEKATQQILKAAETIDEGARALHATLMHDYNRGLSQDIIDQVVRIYEACNFQDLSGQHINKAIDTLKFVEDQVGHMVDIWGNVKPPSAQAQPDDRPLGRALANGPKIDGDHGHVSQHDIDTMFGSG